MRIKITFAGSFQARLATEPDQRGWSPNEPAPPGAPHGVPGKGWTFAWYEQAFDRVIRLSNPVQLRNALVGPWEDAKVTKVEASRSLALHMWPVVDDPFSIDLLVPVMTDPLLGQGASLGQAKFNSSREAGGTGMGYEVLEDFAFSIGGTKFMAQQATPRTRMTGTKGLGEEVQAHYKKAKLEAILGAAAAMHPARRAYLTKYDSEKDRLKGKPPREVESSATWYAMEADIPDIPLTQVATHGAGGVLSITRKAKLDWKLSLNFSRFDGDTLVGRIKGVLEGAGRPA